MTTDRRKVAVVTGAGKRLGRAIALTLAERGWDIAVHYRQSAGDAENTVREIEKLGRRAAAFAADLADDKAVRTLLPAVASSLGAVSCLVNNAALFDYDTAADFSVSRLDAHMHVNLAAPLLLAQALYASTPDGEQSVVINLLDQKLANLNPDFLSYTLSKAALQTATTMLAQALAPRVRIVGVAPGLTMASHLQTDDEFADAHRLAPLGESSQPENIADAVAFAVYNRAITGTTIFVDGGQHLLPLSRDFSFLKRQQ